MLSEKTIELAMIALCIRAHEAQRDARDCRECAKRLEGTENKVEMVKLAERWECEAREALAARDELIAFGRG